MKQYIGAKMIQAEPATREDFAEVKRNAVNQPGTLKKPIDPAEGGYMVIYPDGYVSWSPKTVFEKTYLPLDVNPALKTDAPSISQQMVDDFIVSHETITLGGKCTVVRAILRNGFAIVESSECVSAENYDEKMGEEICMERIKNKTWMLLGFLLQSAIGGSGSNG